ncbi:hypothetical protein [Tsukamurella tyrosinosolvens]|uniref:hypothetical protein n=1 Tax=Tsukamurella tyrosinosolvens TaxID=57704 RepID=UPI001AF9C3AC|nr:hypothetical protein [Tsukamurella tyrosinosolvens]MEC4612518.1 hypothetical protein [Tsukamurella tyrosinosolvens]QRY83729.1 hypothetical protein JVY00_18035 [Tsukamurella tyrosinosolvens]
MESVSTFAGVWALIRAAPKWRVPLVVLGGVLISLGFVAMLVDSIAAIFGVVTGSRTVNISLLLEVVAGLVLPIWFYTQRWMFFAFGAVLLFWGSRKLRDAPDQDDDEGA